MAIDVTMAAETARLLGENKTLPRQLYTDAEVLRLERERIFRRTWQYAGHASWVAEPGDHFTCTAGGIPVVVVRGKDGELNAFVNVCRHRAHQVAQGRGKRSTLQCPYHGWTYGLDGTLRGAPRSARECSFDKSELSLLPVRVETWGPLVFVNADLDAAPLGETLGELPELFAARGGDLDRLEFRKRIEYPVNGNWKLFVENALECYHCPIAHPSFSAAFDVHPEVYQLGTYRYFSTHTTRLVQGGDQPPDQPGFHFYFLWPNFFLSADSMQCELTYLRPIDARTSVSVSDYYFDPSIDEEAVEERIRLTQVTLNEDLALIESQQVGHDSDTVQVGRLLPESEKLLRHFDELVVEALFDSGG